MCQMDISIQYDDVFINIMYSLKIILNHKTILLLKKLSFYGSYKPIYNI